MQQNTSKSSLTDFIGKDPKVVSLPSPSKFLAMAIEAKNVLVSDRDFSDGLQVNNVRVLNQTGKEQTIVSHGLSVGSSRMPPDYTMSVEYREGTKRLMATQWSPMQGFFVGSYKHNFKWKGLESSLDATYINQGSQLKTELDTKKDDYHINMKASNSGEFETSYVQRVSSSVSVGAKINHKVDERVTDSAIAARIEHNDNIFTVELELKDNAADIESEKILKCYYLNRMDSRIDVAADAQFNLSEKSSKYRLGFSYGLSDQNSKVFATITDDFTIYSGVEWLLMNTTQLRFITRAQPSKSDFAFGLSVGVQNL